MHPPTACVLSLLCVLPCLADDRKEVRLKAADLAPASLRAAEPTRGKWWLRAEAKDWGYPGGILMTGKPHTGTIKTGEWVAAPAARFVPYRVPALEIDPGVKGWHRIHVGLYHDSTYPDFGPRLLAGLSGEPYPEYLQAFGKGKGHTAEVYWRAADLTGRKLRFEQPPAPMFHPGHGLAGGITHVRLVPMSAEEVTAAQREIELPPTEKRLFGMLDYTDEVFWWGTLEGEDDVRAIVHRHAQSGFGRIYWRVYGSHLDNSLAVPEAAPVWSDADEKRWCQKAGTPVGWRPYIELTKKYDPLQVAVAHGKKAGCDVHAWVRFTNHNREPYAKFWHDHPQFRAQILASKRDDKGVRIPVRPYKRVPYPRVLSMAYPEVRAYYISFCKQLVKSGTPGILIDLLRHPPIAGYEPIVSDAFKKKHGKAMEDHDLYRDPLVQEHLSEYLRLFLVELRKEVGPKVEIGIRCSGPDRFAMRGKAWIAEGLLDTIIDGNWYSGNGPRPTIGATVAAAAREAKGGLPGRAFAIAEPADVDPAKAWARREGMLTPDSLKALARSYHGKGVARFGLYESTMFTWFPELRRAIRETGWTFDPAKKEK